MTDPTTPPVPFGQKLAFGCGMLREDYRAQIKALIKPA